MENTADMNEWSNLHDLALIYLFVAHGADEEIDEAEQDAMASRLGAWDEEADTEHIQRTLDEVMLAYAGPHSRDLLNTAMVSLKDSMDRSHRIAVLNDLADVASADGVLLPGEVRFIQQLAYYWEIEDKTPPGGKANGGSAGAGGAANTAHV